MTTCDKATAKLVWERLSFNDRVRVIEKTIEKFDKEKGFRFTDQTNKDAFGNSTWNELGGQNQRRVCRILMDVFPQ